MNGHVANSSVIVITMQQPSMNLQMEKQTPEGALNLWGSLKALISNEY